MLFKAQLHLLTLALKPHPNYIYIYTSVKLKICVARRTYKRQPFISKKKNVLQAKRKCGMFWNFPYIARVRLIQKAMKSLLLMQYEELAVWNMRPVMPAAYALTIKYIYTTIAFITIFIIFAFCKCFTVNMRFARKTFL